MSDARPVILGWDAVSPLGTDLEDQWARAAAGESGVGPLTRFPLTDDFPVQVAGEVPAFDRAPYPFLSPRALAHWTSPVFPHALLVVHRALERSGVEITPAVAPRVAINALSKRRRSSNSNSSAAVSSYSGLLISTPRTQKPFPLR